MINQDFGNIHATEFDVVSAIQSGSDWKSGKTAISQALRNGERIKIITSDGKTHPFKVEKVAWVNSNNPTAMQELFCNQDLVFTQRVSHEQESHRKGYHVVSKRLLTNTLEEIKRLYHGETEYQKSPEFAEAQRIAEEAKAAHAERQARYQELMAQQAEFETLQAEFGGDQ